MKYQVKKFSIPQEKPLSDRMRVLVDYLPRRSVENQLWFARALYENGQEFVLVEELQFTEAEIAYLKSSK